MSELLYTKELADRLRKSQTYVHAMKKAGFQMPGGTATLEEARAWLRDNNPSFSCTAYAKGRSNLVHGVRSINVNFS